MLASAPEPPDMTSAAVLAVRYPGDTARWSFGSVTNRIDGALAGFLDSRGTFLTAVGPELETVVAAARRFVLNGGKRLRPRFAYWGWRTVKDADADDTGLLQAAASLELLHACALVHDDIMDDSAVRRGQRAIHAEFAALHRGNHWPGDARRFGAAAAILIGDLLLTWADIMFAAAPLPTGVRPATRAVYDQMRQLVIAGQYLDVLVQNRGEFSIEDALRVARFKTSTYTVEGPLHLGAA
ncbi:MAG: polyprenyl synthetase family protein, partial [Actinocrinis sp.]